MKHQNLIQKYGHRLHSSMSLDRIVSLKTLLTINFSAS